MAQNKIPKREHVAVENTWRLEDIYPTNEAWEEDLKKLAELGEKQVEFKGKLGESGENLLEYLQISDEISLLIDSLANYAHRRSDEDTANSFYQAMKGRLMSVLVDISSKTAFEDPEIIAIPDDDMQKFYGECEGLKLYKRALDRLREKKPHVLSEREEQILALSAEVANVSENTFTAFSDADLKFPDVTNEKGENVQVTHGSYIPLVQSQDRRVRKEAFESLYHTYEKFRNTCASTLDGQFKALNFYSKVRNYNSPLEQSLSANEIPVSVYTNLIDTVHENMQYMYDYVDLRREMLGVEKLHMYDMYVPLVAKAEKKISFEQAKETVIKALAPMGEDYINILKEGFENRWIDVYENEGKTSGAYSAGAKVHPYVLLNHKDTLNCMFTLAHEMGHAIQSYLSNKYQPTVYSEYVIFVAEVASTCNEALLMQYLLKNTEDKAEKAYLINYFLEQFRTTLYRQTMFAEFELKISEISAKGETLTADLLCEIYRELNKLYFGENNIEIDHEIDLEWARIPHFYYDFYVYQYATGYSAAIALSQKILSGGEDAVKDYIGFLKGGCSTDPISLLKGAGVDMNTAEPINQALKLFGELIGQLRELYEDGI